MLDELRQFGRHEDLQARADTYLAAPDLPSLFDCLLARWDDDFGHADECLDIVRRSLCFIASEPECDIVFSIEWQAGGAGMA